MSQRKGSFTPSDLSDKNELRCWSRHVRDELTPSVVEHGHEALGKDRVARFEDFLRELEHARVDEELLRFSRIHTALMDIEANREKWPQEVVTKTAAILQKWEVQLGDLAEIRQDLWSNGGRMAGVSQTREWDEISTESSEEQESNSTSATIESPLRKSHWDLEGMQSPFHCLRSGHNGFRVGHWWIKRAAAVRDGIIHSRSFGITADLARAYAIVMTGSEEIRTHNNDIIKYRAWPADPGRCQLLKNMRTKELVRVLRTYKLISKLAPKAGLRYDGLHRVCGYSIKLCKDARDEDEWRYIFELERCKDQLGMDRALAHPTLDEMDDWDDFQRDKRRFESSLGGMLEEENPLLAKPMPRRPTRISPQREDE